MICHDRKCIFIHIQRCAGTSVEYWLYGDDWWRANPDSKHLTARQARSRYAEYWDEYFTFSIVREPVGRMMSCLKYDEHFGLSRKRNGDVNFDGYHALFGADVIVEFDHRFYTPNDVHHDGHKPGQIYGNILDTPVDFVARFENLATDMARVQHQLGEEKPFNMHKEKSTETAKVTPATRRVIETLYAEDIALFDLG